MRLTVADLPICGKFVVIDIADNSVLHKFDGEGPGDIMPDVAVREVLGMYADDNKIIVEVW